MSITYLLVGKNVKPPTRIEKNIKTIDSASLPTY